MTHAEIPKTLRRHAKTLRQDMTDAERALWYELRAHRLMNLGFRRQLPVAGYIVDFACPDQKLIVELDGSQHASDDGLLRDSVRTATLESAGWRVLRFWNDDVLRNIDDVCMHIVRVAKVADR